MEALIKAFEVVGSASKLADALGVTPSAVAQWKSGERPIPVERAQQIQALTRGAVTVRDLRPDLAAIFAAPAA